MKSTIFFAISLFALALLCQQFVHAQIPTPTTKPIPKPTSSPVAKPTPITKDSSKQAKLMPNYAPVEADSSKYGVIRIRIENKGQQTEVPKGIKISAILTMVDISSTPILDTGCTEPILSMDSIKTGGWVWKSKFGIQVDNSATKKVVKGNWVETCIYAKAHLTQPIKPSQSAWVIANFSFLTDSDFKMVKNTIEKVLNDESNPKRKYIRVGVRIEVEGATKILVTDVGSNFFIKR